MDPRWVASGTDYRPNPRYVNQRLTGYRESSAQILTSALKAVESVERNDPR